MGRNNPSQWRGLTTASHERARATHCRRGHPFDAPNTRIDDKTGRRLCRACCRLRARLARAPEQDARQTQRAAALDAWIPDVPTDDMHWAAGVFEGEGTATITRSGRQGYTRAFVSLTNTDRTLVDFFHRTWPGAFSRVEPKTQNARAAYCWQVSSSRAAAFCRQLLPCIRSTRVRDKFLLLIADTAARTYSGGADYLTACQERREQMRRLNQRGAT